MLVITRREGEEIRCMGPSGEVIIIRIRELRGDRVRVAVECPARWEVHRGEVADERGGEEEGGWGGRL